MSEIRIGLDNGYGQVKRVCADTQETHVFPSVVSRIDRSLLDKDNTYYTYADRTGRYLVGEDAVMHGNPALPSIDSSYVESTAYRVQAMYAIESCIPDLDSKKAQRGVDLVTGLPVEFFKKDRIGLMERMATWENARVRIKSVNVVPQPMGTLMDLSLDWDGKEVMDLKKRRIALIDVGQGTIDAIEIVDGRVSPNYHGRSVGISRMFDELYASLNKTYPNSGIVRADIPKIARDGMFVSYGEDKSIQPLLKGAKKRMAEMVESVIAEAWPSTAQLYRIVVTGGGADALRDVLPKHVNPKQLMIPDQPALANARGFAKIAMTKAKRG